MIFDKLVEIYKKRILTSKDRKNETQKIIQEIDTLICTKSKQKITNEHKIYILNN